MSNDPRETTMDDDAIAVEAIRRGRPNPVGMKFEVQYPDVPMLSCNVANCAICNPQDDSALLGDAFPCMEPFEVVKECLVGGICAILVCAAVLGVGFLCAWAVDAFELRAWVDHAMTDVLRWWLRV